MAMPTVPYKFDDFISDLELITSVGSTDEDKIRRIQKKLRLLISTGNFLPSEAKTPALQRYARHLVHEDPKKRFIVVSLVWSPGQAAERRHPPDREPDRPDDDLAARVRAQHRRVQPVRPGEKGVHAVEADVRQALRLLTP